MTSKSLFKRRSFLYVVNLLLILAVVLLMTDSGIGGWFSDKLQITIKKNNPKIKLICTEGCQWKNSAFTVKNHVEQWVNENGIYPKPPQGESDFLFTIEKTEHGVLLKSIEGTSWNQLQFRLYNHNSQKIDKEGIINKY